MDLEQLANLMNCLMKLMQRWVGEVLRPYELSSMHASYIAQLHLEPEGCTRKELTEHLGVDKANTTRVIRDLQGKGYVMPLDQGAQRGGRLVLTERGEQVGAVLGERIEELKNRTLRHISPQENRQFFDTLQRMVAAVEREMEQMKQEEGS